MIIIISMFDIKLKYACTINSTKNKSPLIPELKLRKIIVMLTFLQKCGVI